MNDSDQLGLEPSLHAEDDEDALVSRRADCGAPLFMWSPSAARENAGQAPVRPKLLLIAIGEKPTVFTTVLLATNRLRTNDVVATVTLRHLALAGACGFAWDAAELPTPAAALTNTVLRVAPGVFLLSVQQRIAPDDAAALVQVIASQFQPERTLILDTISAAEFALDQSADACQHGVARIVDSHSARIGGPLFHAPAAYLAPPTILSSCGAAFFERAQLSDRWARVVVAVDREPGNPCEALTAFASACRTTTDIIHAAMAAGGDAKLVDVNPNLVSEHPIVRRWLETRSAKTLPHL